MIRIKRGVIKNKRHKKVIKNVKGYYGSRSKTYKVAKQSYIKSNQYSYIDRKKKKRYFRKIWIIRLNASLLKNNIKYNVFINNLKKKCIKINRKILSLISIENENDFKYLIEYCKK